MTYSEFLLEYDADEFANDQDGAGNLLCGECFEPFDQSDEVEIFVDTFLTSDRYLQHVKCEDS